MTDDAAADRMLHLRQLDDLRDLLERWLDLAKPGQHHVGQVQELLVEIQRTRNALLEMSMTTASVLAAQHLQNSQALIAASFGLLRAIAGPVSPLNNLTQDFLRRAEALCGRRG